MNKYKFIVIALLTFGVVMTACKDEFLEVAPTNSLSSNELSTATGLDGSVIGTYSVLLGRGGFYTDASNWFWGSVLGGDANKGSDPGDQSQVNEIQNYNTQTTNASVRSKYARVFEGIARANATMRLAAVAEETGSASAAAITQARAEARFLRGHYYFDLKKIFNDVPYVDETWDEISPISNNSSLWPMIEADFQFAADNLPATQSQAGRANSWAARAYLGKAFLFQSKFAEARTTLNDVINNGVTANGQPYALVANYADAFRSLSDNSAESVFASQAAAGTGSINNANPGMVLNFPHGSSGPTRPGGCCGFFQPSFELANSFRTGADGLPLLDGSYNDAGNALANDFGLASSDAFTPDAGNVDPRLDHSVGRRGIPYLDWGNHPGNDWVRQASNGGPYSPKKFIYYQGGIGTENDGSSWTPGYTAVNYTIIRFADVLLMAAEAEIEVGDLNVALGYINQVRARAAASPVLTDAGTDAATYNVAQYTAFGDQTEARTAVRMERKLELSGEGHRFYDLVRWGIAESALNAFLAYDGGILTGAYTGASFTANQDEYLPIPQSEIDLNGTDILSQNPGY